MHSNIAGVIPGDFKLVSGPRGRRGISAVLVVVAIPSILLLGWLAVEFGLAIRALYQARGAADAVALAAAARFADGHEAANADALTAAQSCRGPNGPVSVSVVNAPGGGADVLYGRWDAASGTFTPEADGGPATRVTVRFAVDSPNGAPGLLLWKIFQAAPISFTRTSVAVYSPPRHTTSMLVTAGAGSALDVDGSAQISARGGVSVASADLGAVVIQGAAPVGGVLAVPVLRLAGTMDELSRAGVGGSIEEGAAIPDDPMSAMDLPAIDPSASDEVSSSAAGVTRVAPGAHQSLVASAGTVILEAGVHQFTQAVTLSGSATVQLEDAAIELAPAATLSLSGSAALVGTPLATGDWAGFFLLQRGAASAWSIADGSGVNVPGDAYGPDAAATLQDSSSVQLQTAVLGSLRVGDTASLRLDDRIESLDLSVVPGRARLVR